MVNKRRKGGCRMARGVERQRGMQGAFTGLGLMEGRTLSPLFVYKGACHRRGEILHTNNFIYRSCYYNYTSEQGDIISQPMPAANYGVTGVLLQVFTTCSFTRCTINYSWNSHLCLISQTALTIYKPKLKSGFCQTSFKLSYKSTFSIYE